MNGSRALAGAIVLASLLPLEACFGRGSNAIDSFTERQREEINVVVENQNFYDATIYAIGEGSGRSRLGQVGSNTSKSFELPGRPRSVRFEIRLQAANPFTTYAVTVNPGETLRLTVAADVAMSTIAR
ncbi:MAG: hypothetical protein HY701_03010 [Gemmatimonadetes bacterium]|nr:hypothetical protein [Gemmatimonadota bacterium]